MEWSKYVEMAGTAGIGWTWLEMYGSVTESIWTWFKMKMSWDMSWEYGISVALERLCEVLLVAAQRSSPLSKFSEDSTIKDELVEKMQHMYGHVG